MEQNPQDAPFPVTHYPGPGLLMLSDFSSVFGSFVRGLYMASDGELFAVIGSTVIRYLSPGNTSSSYYILGDMATNTGNLVSMCDNGAQLVIVDGTVNGYIVTLPAGPGSLVTISDPAFYGSTRVDYIDTFMVFNRPSTGTFYTTTSGVVLPFDATYAAAKEGWNDLLVCAACLHDNIWLLGATTSEIWYNAGGTTFPFARMPNSILQQGCAAAQSVVIADNAIYWLSQDRWGRNMVMRGEGYAAKRVSTFAVEDAFNTYDIVSDCIGMVYQLGGHETIGFYFPSAQAWWAFDASTQMWHTRTFGGITEPWIPFCMAGWGSVPYVQDTNAVIVGARNGPYIMQLSRDAYTDIGTPITRRRSWMHSQGDDGQRVHHARFSCSMAGAPLTPDSVNLYWSDDAGQTYGLPVPQTINNQTNGQYQWRRLGYARDRVYLLEWSGVGEFALNGAYIDIIPQGT